MSVRLFAITFGAQDPSHEADFWSAVLDRPVGPDDRGGVQLPVTNAGQPLIRFVPRAEPKTTPNRGHFDLTSSSHADQGLTVARALDAGGRRIDIGQGADAEHTVMADPEDNEFCVIPPGNNFLAGTGTIGCLACDGSQAVGYFWSRALQWPLVWDQEQETAIQAPSGGSKISWGGEPIEPQTGYNRVHLDLAVRSEAELADAATQLTSLGATRWAGPVCRGAVGFADPDGTEFCVLVAPSV
ncbi:VOC family protein [Flexivirga oryzae]|uniref:Glyoxalase-like domain-containing protein n=1 Tax=Flexivirga oryzae TaxID=1794944 RepID=A0A839N2C2_9MICO|nr:VOC family protein [Flexivirga oryzae]MBB2891487.1 hypothetical protein [Flexivirga oryzae]